MNPQPPAPTCVRHPDRPTGLACTRCGRPACPECLRPASVGQHCVDCVREGQRHTRQVRTVAGAEVARSPIPYVTYALIAVNVALFAITALQSRNLIDNYANSSLMDRWVLVPGLVSYGQWERVVGSGFLHFGPIHLALNMFALWIVGRSLEPVLGRLRYIAIYAVALLAGSAACMVFQAPNSVSAGASCAVYGLFGAITVLLIRVKQNPNQMFILIGINVFISFSLPGLSLAGHLGGLLGGTLATLGVLFLPEWLGAKSQEAARSIGWASIVSIGLISLVVIAARAITLG
ncbi:rhomboid family intramembrane serine protease [Nocardia goodfellowii]|uniref:rhomboid family intramembrane serine protease n=1 Tax=Nocardia goodfellowii TaxID=882446 RepID=UPI001AEABDCC|nr:rhomboid family intramembrane serine protease [Nocardia goodfellowii]